MIVAQQSPDNGAAAGRYAPVTPADVARVTAADYAQIQRISRGYCRKVDATRSRKRMDGSATVVRDGVAVFGTDDVSDDVAQDAVLLFARRLRQISESFEASAVSVASREAESWQYVRRDGQVIIVSRQTIMFWAVRDAAATNGYRLDPPPDPSDAEDTPDVTRGIAHADVYPSLAITPYLAAQSAAIFGAGWGDGSDFPTLKIVMDKASRADDLGRAGILGQTAQDLFGGPLNSRWKVQKARDRAIAEFRELTGRLDAARDDLIYRGARSATGEAR